MDQKIPSGITEAQAKGRCCSLDGDADRLVYYYVNESGSFVLLDGDKIAALSAGYLNELIQSVSTLKGKIEIGVVQTAYANGNSTRYFINQVRPLIVLDLYFFQREFRLLVPKLASNICIIEQKNLILASTLKRTDTELFYLNLK